MRLLYINIVILLVSVSILSSQTVYDPTPLMPAKDRIPGYIGFIIGMGQNFQSGEFYVDCLDCVFEKGVAAGFTVGISYDRVALPWLKYGIAGLYDYSGIKSSFVETEIIPFELKNSGIKEDIAVQFRHTGDIDLHYLTAMPYIKLEPVKFFFFRLGFGASLVMGSAIKHDKELLQQEVTLSNGTTIYISIPGNNSYSSTIQNSEVRNLNSLQFFLMPAMGFKINFSETTYLMPYFQYNIPFTNISDKGKDFKINQWRLLFELGFKVH